MVSTSASAWTEVTIAVTRQAAAQAETALEELGALAVTLEDGEDDPVLEPGPGETPLWPTVQVRGLFESGVDRGRVMDLLQTVPGAGRPGNLRWRDVGDQDWERAWMDRFEPMKFGRKLWIVPGGMSVAHDPANVEIQLDPGLAFGTGTHPTTALCLQWLDGQELDGRTVVDFGCGSGILGIAAALKGASRVVCVDNDPQALEATVMNAGRNQCNDRISCHLPEDSPAAAASLVLANILAQPLIDLSPRLLDLLEPGGDIVLSGILEEQVSLVAEAYQACLRTLSVEILDGWARIHGVKR
jgi:ribosomal protein L11 methyltransferase